MAATRGCIADEDFRSKFLTVPNILDNWVRPYRPLRDSTILDFGCGEGIAALGIALNYGPREVVGVDIMPDPERCLPLAREQLDLEALPSNLSLHRVAPGSLGPVDKRFDFIYSWSAFEHVDERLLDVSLELLRESLASDGLLLIQVDPLFYSAEGSHLAHRVREPWGHLLTQHSVYYEKLRAAVPDDAELAALWSTYRTLNRITAPELIDRIRASGFRILRTHKTRDKHVPPPRLLAIVQRDVLVTNQVVILARHK